MRQFWNITSCIYAKYHVQIMLLFVYTTTSKRFVIFTCRYFKLSWNTTALSQSNCRNFSCSGIRLNLSTTATLGIEGSGRCKEVAVLENEELKQQPRQSLRKRHLKSVVAMFQTYSRLFYLIQFVKSWSWVLKDCIEVQKKTKQVVALCSRSPQNRKLGFFAF